MTSYADESVVRFRMSGDARTDIDREEVVVRFTSDGVANKPLCVRSAADGAVWVSTFREILRLRRL